MASEPLAQASFVHCEGGDGAIGMYCKFLNFCIKKVTYNNAPFPLYPCFFLVSLAICNEGVSRCGILVTFVFGIFWTRDIITKIPNPYQQIGSELSEMYIWRTYDKAVSGIFCTKDIVTKIPHLETPSLQKANGTRKKHGYSGNGALL